MKNKLYTLLLFSSGLLQAQTFVRSELPATLLDPWEITYGQDNFLWITERGGKVSRVNPATGAKQEVYIAADFFPGSAQEGLTTCFKPKIGSGTLGLALHPDFLNPATAFIYYVYSYNAGSTGVPKTNFKIVRLKWDHSTQTVTEHIDLVPGITIGYEHLGGRLISTTQNGRHYLYMSIGDYGPSEFANCFSSESENPNNSTQNPNTMNGKIHHFNID